MSSLEYPFELGVELLPKCDGCAERCGNVTLLLALLDQKQKLERAATMAMGTDISVNRNGVEVDAPEEKEEIAREFRTQVGDNLTVLDQQVEAVQTQITSDQAACDGVLKMRAPKNGVSYLVNLCTTPRLYTDPTIHVPVHVEVKPV